MVRYLSLLAFMASIVSPLLAQTTTATMLGVVRETTGALVPRALVTATNTLPSFTRSVRTDETGSYLISNLPNGDYSLTAEKEGFRLSVANYKIGLNSGIV